MVLLMQGDAVVPVLGIETALPGVRGNRDSLVEG